MFSADGTRSRTRYSVAAIERLESLSLIVVKRSRRGSIVCGHFRPLDGANPLQATASMGQRYSFHAHVGGGHRTWTHKEIENESRPIFLAVPLSVMRQSLPSPKEPAAKCVFIDTRKPVKI